MPAWFESVIECGLDRGASLVVSVNVADIRGGRLHDRDHRLPGRRLSTVMVVFPMNPIWFWRAASSFESGPGAKAPTALSLTTAA